MVSNFPQPNITPISDNLYVLVTTYTVTVAIKKTTIPIEVPAQYMTDLASIPPLVRGLLNLNQDGLYRGAAVVHDYLYHCHVKPYPFSVPAPGIYLTRKECDDIFKTLMQEADESPFRVNLFYWAVRTFGWMYY